MFDYRSNVMVMLSPTFTPVQFIWTVVAISVFIVLFILYHMMLTHKKKR